MIAFDNGHCIRHFHKWNSSQRMLSEDVWIDFVKQKGGKNNFCGFVLFCFVTV